jgi:hypothetical protein
LLKKPYDAVIVAVAHHMFEDIDYRRLLTQGGVLYRLSG